MQELDLREEPINDILDILVNILVSFLKEQKKIAEDNKKDQAVKFYNNFLDEKNQPKVYHSLFRSLNVNKGDFINILFENEEITRKTLSQLQKTANFTITCVNFPTNSSNAKALEQFVITNNLLTLYFIEQALDYFINRIPKLRSDRVTINDMIVMSSKAVEVDGDKTSSNPFVFGTIDISLKYTISSMADEGEKITQIENHANSLIYTQEASKNV